MSAYPLSLGLRLEDVFDAIFNWCANCAVRCDPARSQADGQHEHQEEEPSILEEDAPHTAQPMWPIPGTCRTGVPTDDLLLSLKVCMGSKSIFQSRLGFALEDSKSDCFHLSTIHFCSPRAHYNQLCAFGRLAASYI